MKKREVKHQQKHEEKVKRSANKAGGSTHLEADAQGASEDSWDVNEANPAQE